MFYDALNYSPKKEYKRAVSYVLGDVLFGCLLSAGAGKVADVAGDFAKVAKAAMTVTDDGIELIGKYSDDAAKCIDDLADSAKYADDVADVADKVINQFDDVVAYIKKNGKLPDNYITKAEATRLGWNSRSGNLADVAPGKSIGGEIYRNAEGKLPSANGRIWYEADINYTSGYRGRERLYYSNDGLFYKTLDHTETMIQIGE